MADTLDLRAMDSLEPAGVPDPTDGHRARMDAFLNAASALADTIGRTAQLAEDAADFLRLTREGETVIWPADDRGYLSLAEAAQRTGRHPDVLRRWCADGTIPAIRVGRTWALSRETIAELLNHAGRSRPRLPGMRARQASAGRKTSAP